MHKTIKKKLEKKKAGQNVVVEDDPFFCSLFFSFPRHYFKVICNAVKNATLTLFFGENVRGKLRFSTAVKLKQVKLWTKFIFIVNYANFQLFHFKTFFNKKSGRIFQTSFQDFWRLEIRFLLHKL